MSKYKNIKTEVDGILFDSKKEAARYKELKQKEAAGEIKNLRRQVRYPLMPKMKIEGIKVRATYYIADFVYEEDGKEVVEDVKGYRTREYRNKKRQMKERHGIEIREV